MPDLNLIKITGPYIEEEDQTASSTNLEARYFVNATIQIPYTIPGMEAFQQWRQDLGPQGRAWRVKFNVSKKKDEMGEMKEEKATTQRKYENAQERGRELLRGIRVVMQQQGMDLENAALYANCGVPGRAHPEAELQVVDYPGISEKTNCAERISAGDGNAVPCAWHPFDELMRAYSLKQVRDRKKTQLSGSFWR